MKSYDVIHELYHGNIRPCDRGYHSDSDFAITMDAFTTHEKWFRENLSGETGKRFDELISCHNSIVNAVSYENFRLGFQLRAMMVMDAVGDNPSEFFAL